ncbi:MAG: GTPase Era [Bacillota bacterium]|nr:GTPase Era [Bacillota bacterium]
MSAQQDFRSGFLTLLGRPNSGKSTLLNQLVGEKVAIVSDKPQTTRNSIRGVYTDERMQAVFIDTPGVHKPKYKLGKRMMDEVNESLGGGDILLYLVDSAERFGAGEEYIIKLLQKHNKPCFLLLNKIDLLKKDQLLPLMQFYAERGDFAEILPVSALTGEGRQTLLDLIYNYLKQGPAYFPADMISDMPDNFLIAELIREQVLLRTSEEIPHSVAVTVTAIEEREDGLLFIEANIYVERDSQKGVLIGKGGSMLKQIGQAARLGVEEIFGCRVYLQLRVRARKDWRNNEGLLRDWIDLDRE